MLMYFLRKKVKKKCLRNHCLVCKKVLETHIFQSLVDKKVYKINRRVKCSDKCLVYILSRKVCGRQYTGQTVDEFRYRWNNYKGNNNKSLRVDLERIRYLNSNYVCSSIYLFIYLFVYVFNLLHINLTIILGARIPAYITCYSLLLLFTLVLLLLLLSLLVLLSLLL